MPLPFKIGRRIRRAQQAWMGLPTQAMANGGMMVVQLPFDPPADVQHAARLNGCSYIMDTDIVYVKESGALRTCRVLKRFAWEDSLPTLQAR